MIYGYDTSSAETECRAGPYRKGDEIELTVRPTKAHVLQTLTLSGSMMACVKVRQVRVQNDAGITGCCGDGSFTLKPGLRVKRGDQVIVVLLIRKATRRVCFTAAGEATGPTTGPAYRKRGG